MTFRLNCVFAEGEIHPFHEIMLTIALPLPHLIHQPGEEGGRGREGGGGETMMTQLVRRSIHGLVSSLAQILYARNWS